MRFVTEIGVRTIVVVTFDDGPSRRTTPQLLDLLEELNLQVTFFVVGRMVKQNPGVLQKIVESKQRHEICNHFLDHSNRKKFGGSRQCSILVATASFWMTQKEAKTLQVRAALSLIIASAFCLTPM